MKYHKIPKVDKTVCTAEQMIAYNYAEAYTSDYRKKWRECKDEYSGIAKSEFIFEARNFCMKMLSDDIKRKYDIDAIQSALTAGLKNYFDNPYRILSSYAEIGKIFPALYL
jgi:hypothetical protein